MRSIHAWAACLGLAAAATAQQNLFEYYPVPHPSNSATSFSSRYALGGNEGYLMQTVAQFHWRPGLFGLFDRVADVSPPGAAVPTSEVKGFRCRIQDHDCSTPDRFRVVYGSAAAFDGFPIAPVFGTAWIDTPVCGVGSGVRAWTITVAHAAWNPPNTADNWLMGVRLEARTDYPLDGLSVHSADHYDVGGCPPTGDSPRGPIGTVPNYAWQIDGAGARLQRDFCAAGNGAVMRVGVLTEAPVLNMGCHEPAFVRHAAADGPCFGLGGHYPDVNDWGGVGRFDDLAWRIRAAQYPGGDAWLFVTHDRGPGIALGGISGTYALDFDPVLLSAMALDAAGDGAALIPVPAGIRPVLLGHDFQFQALTGDAALGFHMTNLCTVWF